MSNITATYSPEDNKLRLYSTTRLDSEMYTSTPMREAGCTSTRKASFTTARRSPLRERPPLIKRAKPRLTLWATKPKCSLAAKTRPISA